MKKTLFILSLLGTFSIANAVDINTLKWTSDFEMLVNLNDNVENTLEGIDQNHNGIRDDVEYYINTKYKNKPFQKAMFTKAAKTIQTIITLPQGGEVKKHQKLDKELLNLYTCRDYILYKMDSDSLEEEMKDKILFKGKVLNTKKRLQAYIAHKQLLPFQFDDLSKEALKKEKQACIKQYNHYKNSDKKLLSSSN